MLQRELALQKGTRLRDGPRRADVRAARRGCVARAVLALQLRAERLDLCAMVLGEARELRFEG